MPPKMLLGEVLIQRNLLTPGQLEEALDEQRRTNEFLGKILVRKGFVGEEPLLRVLSEQFSMSLVDLKKQKIDWEVTLRFPLDLVAGHEYLPLAWDSKTVTIAVTNPLVDVKAADEIEKVIGFSKIRWVLVTSQDMKEAVALYKQKMTEKIKRLFDK